MVGPNTRVCVCGGGVSAHPPLGELDLGALGPAPMLGKTRWGCLPGAPGAREGGKGVPGEGGQGQGSF